MVFDFNMSMRKTTSLLMLITLSFSNIASAVNTQLSGKINAEETRINTAAFKEQSLKNDRLQETEVDAAPHAYSEKRSKTTTTHKIRTKTNQITIQIKNDTSPITLDKPGLT